MALSAHVIHGLDELAPYRARWDELAVEAQRPFSSPFWALAWWRHLKPDDAQLRVLIVEDGNRLAGILPLFSLGRSYHPLGGAMAPVEPLSRAGSEDDVAVAVARLLASFKPRPATLRVGGHGSAHDWAAKVAGAWGSGRGAWSEVRSEEPIPWVDLGEGFEEWLSHKSSSFRRDMRRNRRRLEDAGGTFRFATDETVERDVAEFLRLHRTRRAGLGARAFPPREPTRCCSRSPRSCCPAVAFACSCWSWTARRSRPSSC